MSPQAGLHSDGGEALGGRHLLQQRSNNSTGGAHEGRQQGHIVLRCLRTIRHSLHPILCTLLSLLMWDSAV